jgi:hypothetical protein
MKPHALFSTFIFTAAAITFSAGAALAVNPVNPSASSEAKMLLNYVYSQFGTKIMAAQHGAQTQYDYVHTVTGKYAAIWGTDLIMSSRNDQLMTNVIGWWAKGVIPTIMWHWGAPTLGEGYTQSKGTIDVNQCFVTGSAINVQMVADLKRIADNLTRLRDAKVPVLWRPLHEASGGWFWWDKSGGPAYVKLWQYMYNYFTKDRGLNNLLWVEGFDGSPSAAYWAGAAYVDIIGSDNYDNLTTSHLNMFTACKTIAGNTMPIAFHECGTIADPANCQKDNAMWSWFMVWDSYITGVDKTYLTTVYNSNLVITLDKLPSWSTLVLDYKKPAGKTPVTAVERSLPNNAAIYSMDGKRVTVTSSEMKSGKFTNRMPSGVYLASNKGQKGPLVIVQP